MADRKRKKNTLSLQQKVDILGKLDKGVKASRISEEYGITNSTVTYYKENREKIMMVASNSFQEMKKKTLHQGELPDLEQRLYDWFLEQRNRNCQINGDIMKAKAVEYYESLYPNREKTFTASNGWLQKFRRRHGIRFLKLSGEKLSCDSSGIEPFLRQFHAKMVELELTEAQVYNADESGLYYRLLPEKTFVAACEKDAFGRKVAKERITFMLCANADGSNKITPLVIGKSKKPRCFQKFSNPLNYDSSSTAWMTFNIFQKWFHNSFVKEVSIRQ